MTKKKEEGERIRKAYAPDGKQEQKMFNFRCDIENWHYLQGKLNKGRYLNELIEKDRNKGT